MNNLPLSHTKTLLFLFFLLATCFASQAQEKTRIIVLTDIENEPDDAESMVRFLTYSNHWDVEGLIATTSTHLRDTIADWRIREIVTAYGKVRENLLLHEKGYPTEAYLKSIIKQGIVAYGMQGVGEGKDSEGSDWIVEVVDRADDRPVWVLAWGGANCLAQALWKVEQTRTKAELAKFVSKIRVYTISDQDDAGYWMRQRFTDLFYIVSPGENYRHATWSGISGERWYKFATGADTTTIRNPWLRANIINNHGPLGAEYPEVEYAMEGDTPTFLGLIENGLNVPGRPDYGGWGGRYELYTPRFLPYRMLSDKKPETRPIWTDIDDEVVGKDGRVYIDNHATIWRWRDHYQNDFAARMDWCIMSYEEANHPPLPALKGENNVSMKRGEEIVFDASPSTDPDGDALTYEWVHYPEVGDFRSVNWRSIRMTPSNDGKLKFFVPENAVLTAPATTHVVLCVTDQGTPALTRYKRIMINIFP